MVRPAPLFDEFRRRAELLGRQQYARHLLCCVFRHSHCITPYCVGVLPGFGQLGLGTTTQQNTAGSTTTLASGVASVSCGDGFTCIITATGAFH